MKIIRILAIAAGVFMLSACGTQTYKRINYMQDVKSDTIMAMHVNEGILVQPKDMISIVVTSRTPELSAPFNLATASYQVGAESATGGQYRLVGYSVDTNGNVDFPIIGEIQVAGLNRWGVSQKIKEELQDRGLLKDPVVSVEFMNFKISVMGEVVRPGTYTISGDKINLLEALSLAGDLTIYGKRDNIKIVREKDGQRTVYVVDIRDSDLFNSPAYYLQQNDVICVEPNSVRAGQSTINENYFKSAGFWVSMGSLAVTVTNLIATLALRANN